MVAAVWAATSQIFTSPLRAGSSAGGGEMLSIVREGQGMHGFGIAGRKWRVASAESGVDESESLCSHRLR